MLSLFSWKWAKGCCLLFLVLLFEKVTLTVPVSVLGVAAVVVAREEVHGTN